MRDLLTVAWKEWREMLRMGGSRRRGLLQLVFSVGLIGVLWPWQMGASFITGAGGVALAAFTSAMHVAGLAPDSFAGERERHTLETLLASRLPDQALLFGKVLALVEYGCIAAVIVLVFGLVTVNLTADPSTFLFYPLRNLLGAALLSALSAGLMAAVGVLISLFTRTVKQAQNVLTTVFLVVLFAPMIALSALSSEWQAKLLTFYHEGGTTRAALVGGAIMLGLQAIVFTFAAVRFRRGRLALEG